MKRFLPLTFTVLALVAGTVADSAYAGDRCPRSACGHCRARRATVSHAWHGSYYHAAWGMPVALVAPPNAEFQTNWGWGVANTRITTIWPQFQRNFPGPAPYERGTFRPTPPWPSDTTQFGVYYVRGPW
jgi:hypothetical protein